MPRSHTCHACGLDLADQRPAPDPHYGLRVVVCPDCRASSVRTREPLIAGWRRARRLVGGSVLLLLHGGVLLPALGFSSMLALAIAGRWIDPTTPAFTTDGNFPFRLLFFGVATAVGLWMGLSMPHRRSLTRAASWAVANAVVCAVVTAIILGTRPLRLVDPADLLEQPRTYFLWFLVTLAAVPVIVLAEWPARAGRWVLAQSTAALFRWRRARARARRSGA